MKDAYYFSHDANARHDPKIIALKSVYGLEGYGRYWILVEMLREQKNYKLILNDTKYSYTIIANQLQCTPDEAKIFIKDCIEEFHLFKTDGQNLWSDSLIKRMKYREEIRAKRRAAGSLGGSKTQAKPKQERKGKERK